MKKISVKTFRNEQSITRLKTEPNHDFSNKKNHKNSLQRFSCADNKQNDFTVSKLDFRSTMRNTSGQWKQLQSKSNLLRNMLESSDRKRSQILSNLIKTKINFFSKSKNQNQNNYKMVKVRTQVSQTKNDLFISPRRISDQKNQQLLKLSKLHNPRNSDHSLISQRIRPLTKLSHKQSQHLRNSFNKRIKEIKLRRNLQKQQAQSKKICPMEAYSSTLKGQKHEENQDSICYSQGIYVLCDGHGSNGKQVSSFVAQIVNNYLKQCLDENKIDETIIQETFRKIDLELDNSNCDTSFSGCTCVAIVRYDQKIYCINVGDSKAILSKGFNVFQLSKLHKPDVPTEKSRIQNYGGVVKPTQIGKDKFLGPMRIWAPGKNSWGPGLALSRAFGDKAARKYGLISVPQVTKISLSSDEQFIIIGSDGLYDFFQDQQISNFVHKCLRDKNLPKSQIANLLVNEARKKWISDSDDISCIIIFL